MLKYRKFAHFFSSGFHGLALLAFVNFAIIGVRNLVLSKLLGPGDYGINSLSSQILSFLAFLDFGAVALLQREIPRNIEDIARTELVLFQIRRITFRSYLVSSVALLVTLLFLNLMHISHWNLAIVAALIIFPIQNTLVFKMAVLNSTRRQSQALRLLTASSAINFILTFIFYHLFGLWIILVAPFLGFLCSQLIFKRNLPHLPLRKIMFVHPDFTQRDIFSDMKSVFGSNLAAYVLQNVDFYLALFSQSQVNVGLVGFALNILSLIPVLPIIISNKMSPILNERSERFSIENKLHLILKMRDSIVYVAGFATLFAAGFASISIKHFFTSYTDAVPIIWIFGVSFFIYTSTFFTSTFALFIDKQSEIFRIQSTSILFESIILLLFLFFFHINLIVIASISIARSIFYLELTRKFVKRNLFNSNMVLRFFRLKIGLYALMLIGCGVIAEQKNEALLNLGLSISLVIYLSQFRKQWRRFNLAFADVAN